MGAGQRFAIPDGWMARGFRLEVEPTTAEQPERIAQSFGGRRFAYNWALAQVKASLDARAADRDVQRGGVAAPVPLVGDHGGQAHVQRGACEALEDHREVAGAYDTRTDPPVRW